MLRPLLALHAVPEHRTVALHRVLRPLQAPRAERTPEVLQDARLVGQPERALGGAALVHQHGGDGRVHVAEEVQPTFTIEDLARKSEQVP